MHHQLGRGAHGAVYRGEFNPTGFKADSDPSQSIDCASKHMKLTAENRDDLVLDFNRQLKMLEAMKHENIVKLYEWAYTGRALYQACEFIPEGYLRDHLKNYVGRGIGENQAQIYFKQIASVLIAMEDKGFIHRDINPDTCFLMDDKKTLKVGFGLPI